MNSLVVNYFNVKNHDIWEGDMIARKERFTLRTHPFPKVLGYMRGGDIKEGDVMDRG